MKRKMLKIFFFNFIENSFIYFVIILYKKAFFFLIISECFLFCFVTWDCSNV